MLFPTMTFLLFYLVVYCAAWSLEGHNARRKAFLLAASWVFYGAWNWKLVALLAASAAANWWIALRIDETTDPVVRRRWVAAGVAANLLVLAGFKYFGFFLEQMDALLHAVGWQRDLPLLEIILPIGVSFFTFQGISYIVDVHRGTCRATRSLLDVTLLMSFFPHLVAGPIVRAADLLPQFAKAPTMSRAMATHGLLLICWGLFKKVVVATELATGIVDPVFFDPSVRSAADLWLGVYAYAAQIYCDFSAYSDIAIGVAALLGYRFARNFDQPYRSASLQEFWRRWHISLSSWLGDYLYRPLGGNRGGLLKTCRNLMITMLLGGLWHGAAWTFVIWGAWHGAVLSIERIARALKPAGWQWPPRVVGVLLTFHVVCIGWILFRATRYGDVVAVFEGLGRWDDPAVLATPFMLALTAFGLWIHFLPTRAAEWSAFRLQQLPSPAMGLAVGLALLVVEAARPEGMAPFIYFQF